MNRILLSSSFFLHAGRLADLSSANSTLQVSKYEDDDLCIIEMKILNGMDDFIHTHTHKENKFWVSLIITSRRRQLEEARRRLVKMH